MRRTFGIGLAAAVFAFALGCGKGTPTSGPGGPAAPPGIEGDWELAAMEINGNKMPEKLLADTPAEEKKIKATGDKLITTKGGKEEAATYKIDRTKTPNEIDITSTKKDGKDGKTEKIEKTYGICKLEGDTLTICAVDSEKPADRPKEFKTTPENKAMMMVLKKK